MVLSIFTTLTVMGWEDASFKVNPICLKESAAIEGQTVWRSHELSPGSIPRDGGGKRKRRISAVYIGAGTPFVHTLIT